MKEYGTGKVLDVDAWAMTGQGDKNSLHVLCEERRDMNLAYVFLRSKSASENVSLRNNMKNMQRCS